MAITIRTGANGSYKSAYTTYFKILPALEAGRVVVTNVEGMQPLHVIEKRLGKTFPSTTKLIRISSRDQKGISLWQYWFCWCPLGALIVIDECQDIYSTKIGFKMANLHYRPLSDFLPDLPDGYESFFYSRYTPFDLSKLDPSEIDDRGVAQYDDEGRIIYPLNFNEGFMRHRKYNWDIELLSPDWSQIDSGIKACAEQCFYHKGRDGYFFAKRKPYIYAHPKNVSTPSIPKGKTGGLMTKKIPLDAHLLYKSTATDTFNQSGQINMAFKNPKVLLALVVVIICVGYFIYGLSSMAFDSSAEVEASQTVEPNVSQQTQNSTHQGDQVPTDLSSSGDDHQSVFDTHSEDFVYSSYLNKVRSLLGLPTLDSLYYTGHTKKISDKGFSFYVSLEAVSQEGVFYLNDEFLRANDIKYVHYSECLLRLSKGDITLNVICKPEQPDVIRTTQEPLKQISLFNTNSNEV